MFSKTARIADAQSSRLSGSGELKASDFVPEFTTIEFLVCIILISEHDEVGTVTAFRPSASLCVCFGTFSLSFSSCLFVFVWGGFFDESKGG